MRPTWRHTRLIGERNHRARPIQAVFTHHVFRLVHQVFQVGKCSCRELGRLFLGFLLAPQDASNARVRRVELAFLQSAVGQVAWLRDFPRFPLQRSVQRIRELVTTAFFERKLEETIHNRRSGALEIDPQFRWPIVTTARFSVGNAHNTTHKTSFYTRARQKSCLLGRPGDVLERYEQRLERLDRVVDVKEAVRCDRTPSFRHRSLVVVIVERDSFFAIDFHLIGAEHRSAGTCQWQRCGRKRSEAVSIAAIPHRCPCTGTYSGGCQAQNTAWALRFLPCFQERHPVR